MPHLDIADRLAGGVWGHLIGDAVGVPYEFRPAHLIKEIEFGASGTHRQPAGTWSDDGALMLALLDSQLSNSFDTDDQGARSVAWWRQKAYTPDNDGYFDIGGATSSALARIEAGVPAEQAGGTGERDNGNGSLMRILPVALTAHDLPDAELVNRAHRASRVTHGTPRALAACALYVLIAKRLLAGGPEEALSDGRERLRGLYEADADAADLVDALTFLEGYTDRAGRGRVWDSFWAAWDAFASAESHADTVQRAIRYGNDTDTTAAIAGGLAGIHWGLHGLRPDWLTLMRGHDIVDPLVDRLIAAAGDYRTSTASPIRVNWVDTSGVPNGSDWKGHLGMTFLPGKHDRGQAGNHWRTIETDAGVLREQHGVETLVLLVEDEEVERTGLAGRLDALERAGIEVMRYPIVDEGIPLDRAGFRDLVATIRRQLADGRSVAVACRGGLGRTGTVVGCLLRTAGLSGKDAIKLARASRHNVVNTREQERFIEEFVP